MQPPNGRYTITMLNVVIAASSARRRSRRAVHHRSEQPGCLYGCRGLASLQFVNGRVLTLDGKSSVARGLAVRGNRIHAVGSNRSLKKLADRGTEVIDLRCKTVMPGFIDAHAHMDREGLKRLYPSLGSAHSVADIQRIVQRQVKRKNLGNGL